MSTNAYERRRATGAITRGRLHVFWDAVFGAMRAIARHGRGLYTTLGIFVVAGALLAVAGTWLFATLAGHVSSGRTQAFDDAVMHWVADNRFALLTAAMVEVTALGTGIVVMTTVFVAGIFLWASRHHHSALLLAAATVGGLILNNLLKAGFDRPRPRIFDWGTHAMTSSFPSGHAMSAVVVYGTVAYLVARLQPRRIIRTLTLTFAFIVIVLICASRVYLGVHYPSDVLAGSVIGVAWAAFCMAILEASQLYARRNAPQALAEEAPAPAPGPLAPEAAKAANPPTP